MVEHTKNSALPGAVSDVVADVADLFQKELRLAKAELSEKLSLKFRGGIWMLGAAALGIFAVLLLLQASVFAIASTGIALHWSCLIVAAVLAAAGAAAFFKAQSDMKAGLTPDRTLQQVKRDISVAKEQLA